jgi:hypothetical protein
VGELEPEGLGHLGVDLEGVPEPELPVLEPGLLGEVLVEQLADRDGVCGLDGVRGREVVVLAGVDDDPGPGVDLPEKRWSTNVRTGLMSRKRMPYIESFSIMSRRSSPARRRSRACTGRRRSSSAGRSGPSSRETSSSAARISRKFSCVAYVPA